MRIPLPLSIGELYGAPASAVWSAFRPGTMYVYWMSRDEGGEIRFPCSSNTKTEKCRRFAIAGTAARRRPRCSAFAIASRAFNVFASAKFWALPRRACSDREEKTEETARAVTAAIAANASGSHRRIPIPTECALSRKSDARLGR